MTIPLSDLRAELDDDLSRAALQLADARVHRQQRDSEDHRRAVRDWLDRIDALLDMRLDAAGWHRLTPTAVT